MKHFNLLYLALFICVVILSGCASANNQKPQGKGGVSKQVLNHDGYEREYLLYKPKILNKNKKIPLIFVLHGGGGTMNQIMNHTKRRFNQLADTHKFYVVYPQGLEKGWNDGRNDLKQFASQNNIDDVGFIKKLIKLMHANYNIDADRVFSTGISNGGFMSFRLGCELRNDIRAIAPVTASVTVKMLPHCGGKSNVSLAVFNGTADELVPYDGGHVTVFKQKRGKILSTQDSIDLWLEKVSCSNQVTQQELPNIKRDGTTVTKFEYQQCKNNNAVTLFRINGGGHSWPGGKSTLKRIVGKTSEDINACDEIWKFFSDLP